MYTMGFFRRQAFFLAFLFLVEIYLLGRSFLLFRFELVFSVALLL